MKKKLSPKLDMLQMFLGLQETMLSKLKTIRKNIKHPTTKGDGAESIWVEFLRKYLPARYSVDRAIVIDTHGNTSESIDVVIYDRQYTPFIFREDGINYIPVESVYAVFEAKQEITKPLLQYALKKIESVSKLQKTSAPVVDKGKTKDRLPTFRSLGGFLALSNGWKGSIETNKTFRGLVESTTEDSCINIGCVLGDKSFVVSKETGKPEILFSQPDETLIFFFLNLVQELQKLGTVRPTP